MKIIEYEGITYKVGKNSAENWELLSESQCYTWFHLASFSSCYVICCTEDPTDDMIRYSAELCKSNTKYRNLKNLKVNYTPISNLKKGPIEGMVIMKSNRKVKNIVV